VIGGADRRRVLMVLVAWVLAPTVLGGLLLVQAKLFRDSTCETYDEWTYLQLGLSIYRKANFSNLASPMCPPLPILLEYWLPAFSTDAMPGDPAWNSAIPELIRLARLTTSVLIGVPLVVLAYAWVARRRGWAAGMLAGGLVALSPTVVANASIATTDACFALFGVVMLAALRVDQIRSSRRSFAVVGAALGLALAAKQSAVIFLPVILIELLPGLPDWGSGRTRVDRGLLTIWWLGLRMGALCGLALVVDWALYGFSLAPKFGDTGTHLSIPVVVPMVLDLFPNGEAMMDVVRQWGPPLALDTLAGQLDHASMGHSAFLMGKYSAHGWWYFFPVAIALKSTPAELVALGLVVALACRRSTWRDPARRLWLVTMASMLGSGMSSSINIGQRYMILIYPLSMILVGDWLGELGVRRPARALAVGAALLVWQGVSAWGIAPHYLSYFNSFGGGPTEGYRSLVDSSLDWGQDLPSLRRELEARHYHQVALCYFGTANAQTYGIRSVDWRPHNPDVAAACDWLAISATSLQGVYGGDNAMAKRLDGLATGRAGYSIFLYDLKDPRVRTIWDELRGESGPRPKVREADRPALHPRP
jgi:4-amino-4-deoxy-L-arabinose transferase-like glycosyltransferase